MGKAIVVLLFTVLSLANFVVSQNQNQNQKQGEQILFVVRGRVICDTCNIGVTTPLSKPIPGAVVQVKCTDEKTKKVAFTSETKTESDGTYQFTILDDGQPDTDSWDCEVLTLSSPKQDCKIMEKVNARVPSCVKIGHKANCRVSPFFYKTTNREVMCDQFITEMTPQDMVTLAKIQIGTL